MSSSPSQTPSQSRPWPSGDSGNISKEEVEQLRDLAEGAKEQANDNASQIAARRHTYKQHHQQTLEDVYSAAILAGIGVGVLGLLAALAVGGYGFAAIFIAGLLFLGYAYSQGLPPALG